MAKFISSSIISVILITTTSFLIIFMLLSGSFYNEQFNIKCLDDTNYVAQCSTDIQGSLINLSASTGIKEEVIVQSVSLDDLRIELVKYYTAMCKYLQNGSGKFEYVVDTKNFEDKMYGLIKADLSKDHIFVDKNSESGIMSLVKESGKVYANMIIVNTDLVKVFNKFFYVYVKYKLYALGIFISAILLLIFINRKEYTFLRYLGASFTLTGLVTLGAYIISTVTGISHKLNLEPVYLKKIMEAILSEFLKNSFIIGICVTGLGLLLILGNRLITKHYQ